MNTTEWQPIETFEEPGEALVWDGCLHWWGYFDGKNWTEDEGITISPTHWLPIPEPPEENA